MNITDPSVHFDLLSVIDLHLPAQNCTIAARPHSTLSFRTQGDAELRFENESFQAETGSVLFVPADSTYEIRSQSEEAFCINLDIHCQEPLQPQLFAPKNVPVLADAFQSIYQTWNSKRPGYYHKCMSLIYSILSHLDKQCSATYHSPSFLSIKNAVQYMHEHFSDPDMKVSTLCKMVNLSDTQFRRHFFEIYQTTPVKYLQQLRINYAADLLIGSSLSIDEVSFMSGFSDPKYFCFVFKKLKHSPPSAYRTSM
jgi:AraC-like DNA-binding protein